MSGQQPTRTRRVAVVGGGVSGLAAAYELARLAAAENLPVEVVLLEASARAGGAVRTHSRAGFLLEGGPDSFISEKPEALDLARELGLEAHLVGTSERHRRAFVVRGGRLRPVPEGFQLLAPSRLWPFVTTDIFSWTGKLRIAAELFVPRRDAGGDDEGDDESLAQFVRRRFGREALERMAQPMVGGIYTADPERLSLRATMPRFLDMERAEGSVIRALFKARLRARSDGGDASSTRAASSAGGGRGTSGARYGLFLSFDGGMQMLTDRLAARLPHGTLRANARVEALDFDAASRLWRLRLGSGDVLAADAVCLALPAYAAAKLLRATDAALASELDSIPYASTATVNLAYRRADIPHPLDGFGFVVPHVERRRVIACSFSSVKFANRAPEGHALLRAFVGGALQPETFDLEEGAMIASVREDLRELLGVAAPPLFAHVEKWPRSMAQYALGHLARVRRINERLAQFPSLRLAGNAYEGTGIPDCIRAGASAARELAGQL